MDDDLEFYKRRLGTTLRGKWKIERLLGVGGMAAVYVAVHTIGHRVAIKILHPEVAASSELRARFEQEAHAVNRFSHPGAVSITDTDVTEDGCPFLVLELLEGDTLQAVLDREGKLDPQAVLSIGDQLLDVLAAAHAHGIIHRDIKPDNLFLLREGRLKVLDFGIARMKEGAPRTLHTKTGMAMGTITYMPPEQVRGEPVDGRADLFAVGATLFRLLTGRRIHQADTHADMLVMMASVPAPALSTVAKELEPTLCQVVDCALAFNRQDRYPDALTMQADIRALREGKPPPFASARALGIAPTVPSTVRPGLSPLGAAVTGDGPTQVEPYSGPSAPVPQSAIQQSASAASAQQSSAAQPVVPHDPTVPLARPAAAPAPTVPALSPEPGTWVSGQSPPAAAVLAAAANVAIVPTPSPKRPLRLLPWALGVGFLLLILVGIAVAFALHLLSETTPPQASAASATPDPSETDTAPTAASSGPVTGKLPTTKSPPPTTTTTKTPGTAATVTTTTTTTATGTTTVPLPTTTTTTPQPGNTDKTPPGQNKDKDKDKGHKKH